MIWRRSWRADPAAREVADRHYNRPPGGCLVLVAGEPVDALWITSTPRAEYVSHAWAGAWVCSVYRNERPDAGRPPVRPGRRSSDLIRQAIAASVHDLGPAPNMPHPVVTFVDETKVRPKRTPGRCFIEAGFEPIGRTAERDYLALGLPGGRMPAPAAPRPRAPRTAQGSLL